MIEKQAIRKATCNDRDEIVGILAEAFRDDPIFKWMSDDNRLARNSFAASVPAFYKSNELYLHEQGLGAALWLPPGVKMRPPVTWEAIRDLASQDMKTNWRLTKLLFTFEKHHPKNDHFYLFAIGTRDAGRGKGIGTALMQEVLQHCDSKGIPAYLENSNEKNLAFYQGHGFKVQKKLQVAKDSPPLWTMWRDPIPR